MAAVNPTDPKVGQIYVDHRFYVADDGASRPKYFLILGRDESGDIVARLLTSQSYGRSKDPRCHHGDPYPSYYLGVLGNKLGTESWLDLRHLEDFDDVEFADRANYGFLAYVMTLDHSTTCAVLDCAARADDTTYRQETVIRDQRADLGCP